MVKEAAVAVAAVVESDRFPNWEKSAWPPTQSLPVYKVLNDVEARDLCNRVRSNIKEVRGLLLALYEGEGWRALGYRSWRDCVVNEFEQSKSFCYRALAAARVERNFSQIGKIDASQIPESHLLPLTDMEPDQQVAAYELAIKLGQDKDRVTMRDVKAAVKQLTGKGVALSNPDAHDEHYTPDWIWQQAEKVMGGIDLDPASNSHEKPHVSTAKRVYTKADDGLSKDWSGNVWLNPPYCRGETTSLKDWIAALARHYQFRRIKQACLLLPAYTDTGWWHQLMELGPVVCFFRGRLRYFGNIEAARFPSALVYIGENLGGFWHEFRPHGRIYQEIEPGMFGE
jgi:phage N-6-adenine-methyltransferase